MRNVVEEAVAMHGAGYHPVVLGPQSKVPDGLWGELDYKSEEAIRQAFGPDNNLGLRMADGLVDVDVDSKRVSDLAAQRLPRSGWVTGRAKSRSMHHFYRIEQKMAKTSFYYPVSGKAIIELRTGRNAQTMMPPSTHPSGEEVIWIRNEGAPTEADGNELLEIVTWLAVIAALDEVWPQEGSRHECILALAGGLARLGWKPEGINELVKSLCWLVSDEEVADRLMCVRTTFQKMAQGSHFTGWPKLADHIGEKTVRKVCDWLGVGDEPLIDLDGPTRAFSLTEDGNSERLVFEADGNLRYTPARGWLEWYDGVWVPQHKDAVVYRAAQVARDIWQDATAPGVSGETRKAMVRHATRSLKQTAKEAVERGARSVPAAHVDVEELDHDPWAFACANGIVDLRTGELREARRSDYITMASRVSFSPEVRSVTWDSFLTDVTNGDEASIKFLQRMAGYTLTGLTWEEVFFFIHGGTATGKSTFIAALQTVAGDYGYISTFETFLKRRETSGGPRPDLANLVGRRFVAALEADRGKELAEGVIKQLTGGDTITVRHLYREEFSFNPCLKLWLSANYVPAIPIDDAAMWRRAILVPFDHTIPPERRNPRLKVAMRDPEGEVAQACLAWAVEGARLWVDEGLGEYPQAVVDSVAGKRAEFDTMSQWLEDEIEFFVREGEPDPTACLPAGVILGSYNGWLSTNGYRPVSKKLFSDRALASGRLPKRHLDGRWIYYGVGLRASYDSRTGTIRL